MGSFSSVLASMAVRLQPSHPEGCEKVAHDKSIKAGTARMKLLLQLFSDGFISLKAILQLYELNSPVVGLSLRS
jgi:hypothetical protein